MKYTKEQLAGMSDFEVNKALALALGWRVADINNVSLLGFTESFHKRYPNTIWVNKGDGCWEQICFTGMDCTNDIMPLAFEYKIDLIALEDGYAAEGNFSYMDFGQSDRCLQFYDVGNMGFTDRNPLRAIACCLILLLQDKRA